MWNSRRGRAGAALALVLPLAACSTPTTGAADGAEGELEVLASFYPLQYVAEKVGGTHVSADSVTPPGVDPHDLELAPAEVARLDDAGLVVYLSGFQAAMDEAVEQTSPGRVLDVAPIADETAEEHAEHAAETSEEHAEAGGEHAGETSEEHAETADEHAGHAHAEGDPHFWLDPTRLADVAHAVADELSAADPDNASEYTANAEALVAELTALDEEYASTLATCEIRTIVVGHEAYGYLGERYNLEQIGISGLDPESEPSPARLAEIADVVEAEGVTTIFAETLVNPQVSESLASDLGVEVAVLDPIGAQLDPEADYQDVMRSNLQKLQEALSCS